MNQLQKLSEFRKDLAEAELFEEIKLIMIAADAYAEMARKDNMLREHQNEVGVFRVQVKEKLGRYLDEHFPHGVRSDRRVANNATVNMPVNEHESSDSRLIARTEPEVKQEIMEEIIQEGDVITPNKVVKEIRRQNKINESKEDKKPSKPRNLSFEGELQEAYNTAIHLEMQLAKYLSVREQLAKDSETMISSFYKLKITWNTGLN